MTVTINGEQHTVESETILDLLAHLQIDARRVAVELNMDILPKTAYETTKLQDGDSIEIVHFVGGG